MRLAKTALFALGTLGVLGTWGVSISLGAKKAKDISARDAFVQVNGTRFEVNGTPYRFAGTNLWYGMNLGAAGTKGDRPRLIRELDRLKALGITNLRVLGASEGPSTEPWRITPALQANSGLFDPDLLQGLDFLLAEMAKRDMRAVICLNNFWPWSGGMAQYLNWAGAGSIPYPPPAEGGSWDRYQKYTTQFYSNAKAVAASEGTIRLIVTRTNSITGKRYKDDPTIMAWQLANEPRGGDNTEDFARWIEKTSNLIKSVDPSHLVSLGSEGDTPFPAKAGTDFVANHSFHSIDYVTAHIWAQNWEWFDPAHPEATYSKALVAMHAYLSDHLTKAQALGKPFVLEEFGLARDGGSYDPASPTTVRDQYFSEVFTSILESAQQGGPAAGANFWAWSGEARPQAPFGGIWKEGTPFTGDPPHEQQGWYGIYDSDASTQTVISSFASAIAGKETVKTDP